MIADDFSRDLTRHVARTIQDAAANAPRNQQAAIGPSEVGDPCVHKLARKLLNWPATNTSQDLWASTQGVAGHGWLADTFTAENARLGRERYLVERRVQLTPTLAGSSDLFDRDLACVVDWKISAPEKIKRVQRDGPGQTYRTQGHLYGLGQQLAGEHVERVAIVFLPRASTLRGIHAWTEPYDPHLAVEAIKRLDTIRDLLLAVDPERNPAAWELFPRTESYCTYCDWWLPGATDPAQGCPGIPTAQPKTGLEALIA